MVSECHHMIIESKKLVSQEIWFRIESSIISDHSLGFDYLYWHSTLLLCFFHSFLSSDYTLHMDDTPVYSGLEHSYTQSGLTPYERHVFVITACTKGGCTHSGQVTGSLLNFLIANICNVGHKMYMH